jgi:flagellar hook protein FlgE
MAGSTVTMFTRSNETLASNVGAKEAWGHKKKETTFSNSFVGSGSGGVSYVSSKTRATNDVQGTIVNTGVVSDIAINGAGLLVVSSTLGGESRFTRRGDFRQDELGFWKNGSDQLLKAWKLDANGNLPQNSSLLGSLEAVNFASTKGSPIATSVISVSMNLNSDQEALRGAGINAILNGAGKNANKGINDIIFPESVNGTSLALGDQFTFRSSEGLPRTVTFGGIVPANKPSADSRIFGASSTNVRFIFPNAPTPGQLANGQQLIITVGGEQSIFTVTTDSEDPDRAKFNTISGLAAAINKTGSLRADISDGRLYIASKKANDVITFANGQGGTIKEELGLVDLIPLVADENRFNSLATLRDAVNQSQSTYSLKATVDGTNFKITSLLATSTFDITASSLGKNSIGRATINPNNNEVGRATCFISAPGHNLQPGDFVRIAGLGNVLAPDGVYSIGAINSNGFTIGLIDDGSAFPAANAAPALVPAANASWQKIAGQTFPSQTGNITASVAGGGPQDITITLAGHGLIQHDVIYVNGGLFNDGANDIVLSAGYYRVTNVAGNDFHITAVNSAVGAVHTGGAAVTFHKVGTVAAALPLATTGTFNTNVFTTVAATNRVNYYIGTNHTYAVGDNITFTGLQGAGLVFDGVTIRNNIPYKVKTIDPLGFITFELDAAGGAATAGGVNSVYGAGCCRCADNTQS